ncbi:MAG: class I tRNA ligase family protein [Cyanobacteria bacterium REEB446]|nr:class I tRNA ligase family protein [Cyanobacteria bacterium REEB446]
MNTTLPFKASYDFLEAEQKWLAVWLDKKIFQVNKDLNNGREVFSIALPPPNVTGELHMGHALGGTIQDVLIRYHRMRGYDVHWQIGSDHAGIGTQLVVEKKLKGEEKLRKEDLGREAFLERIQAWKEQSGNQILEQMKRLGFSPDYDRTRYTMDAQYQEAVLAAFKKYHAEGYIYKGKRLTNWCPKCLTSLSDLEIEEPAKTKKLYEIKYKLEKPYGEVQELIVATTRPETMFGDTAVAINPYDERYLSLINEIKSKPNSVKVLIPFINKAIPVILDEQVKLDFGTGALKVTPAHDFNDNLIGKRHGLAELNIFNDKAELLAIPEVPTEFQGLDRYKARTAVEKALALNEALVKVTEYTGTESLHDRCNTEIEPALSDQWYLSMKQLAEMALNRVINKGLDDSERTDFIPERYEEPFKAWLENIQDWCISRQIWWGHQIPIEGETDVLDTWFSSALWPFISMADDEAVLKKYYPTTVLATAREIINLWVTRMIFSSEFFRQEKAFSKVLIHPVVQTPDGKRMSKSKGNAIDPLLLVRNYGADASRMWYAQVGVFSSQDVRFPGKSFPSKEDPKVKDWECEVMEKYKRFANKLYNSAKFTCMNLVEDPSYKSTGKFKVKPITELNFNEMTFADRWILYTLEEVLFNVSDAFARYDIGAAQELIFDFTWNHFCDWYIEFSKIQDNLETKNQVLFYVLASALRALQPFMPFVTEEIWQSLMQIVDFAGVEDDYFTEEYKAKPYVAFAKFPEDQKGQIAFLRAALAETKGIGAFQEKANVIWSMKLATEIISKIRNTRQSLNISWSDEIKLFVSNPSEADISTLIEISPYIKRIAKCSDIFMDEAVPEKPLSSFIIKSENAGIGDCEQLKDGTAHNRASSRLRRTNDRSVLQVHEDHEDNENAGIGDCEQSQEMFFHIPLQGLVDIDKLKINLEDKLSKLNKSKQQLETRLAAMLNKAPEERIQEAKGDLEKLNLEEKIYLEELNSL